MNKHAHNHSNKSTNIESSSNAYKKFLRPFAFFIKTIHQARESNYKAKDVFLFCCYVLILLFALPSTIERIEQVSMQDSTYMINYVMIIFVPLLRLVVEFGANLVGLCVLFFCAILSLRYKILQNYMVLFVLYLLCAYPSFLLLSLWRDIPPNLLSIANNDFLELVRLVFGKKAYYMAIFIYAKRVCYILLFFAIFDVVFCVLKSRFIPRIIWWNLMFSFVLCVGTILAYYFCVGELIWQSWLGDVCFIFGI